MPMLPPGKTLAAFFGSLLALAAILVFATNWLLTRISPAPPTAPATILPSPDVDLRLESPAGNGDTSFTIQRGSIDPRPITYTEEKGFNPPRFEIRNDGPIGCLITVLNKSDARLRVGVDPHDPSGDPGADYGEIPPGGSALLDVRYPGLESVGLHNHLKPETSGLWVSYGEGCR